jgi:coenzyme F420-reducing hydrogenase alpha subunit
MLSQQNFQQGVAMLKDQTNQSMQQLYAQVEANAAEASTSLKSQLVTIQANTNATLETMDKTFAQTTATNATQEGYAQTNAAIGEGYNQANADQNYGISVRLGYLQAVNTTQTALMNTIANIQSNPNINTTQAQAAVQQAVDQFNSFMTMNNAYYSSMVPTASSSNPAAYLPGFPHN